MVNKGPDTRPVINGQVESKILIDSTLMGRVSSRHRYGERAHANPSINRQPPQHLRALPNCARGTRLLPAIRSWSLLPLKCSAPLQIPLDRVTPGGKAYTFDDCSIADQCTNPDQSATHGPW